MFSPLFVLIKKAFHPPWPCYCVDYLITVEVGDDTVNLGGSAQRHCLDATVGTWVQELWAWYTGVGRSGRGRVTGPWSWCAELQPEVSLEARIVNISFELSLNY